jgi:hypothetical protein
VNLKKLLKRLIGRPAAETTFRCHSRWARKMPLECREAPEASFHSIGVMNQARVDRAVAKSGILQRREIGIVTSMTRHRHLHMIDRTRRSVLRPVGHRHTRCEVVGILEMFVVQIAIAQVHSDGNRFGDWSIWRIIPPARKSLRPMIEWFTAMGSKYISVRIRGTKTEILDCVAWNT